MYFGAHVQFENDAGETLAVQIVGPDEIYGQAQVISIDAPLARAALGKQVDDAVIVTTPSGSKTWYINAIHY